MRLVILHYHIFKNAGSTFEDILDHSFGDRFGTSETSDDRGLISNRDLRQYLDARPLLQAFSSHQIRYPVPQAPGYLFFDICFLRDPLDRVRSFYDYFRQRPNPADPMSGLANNCSLGDFVAGVVRHYSLFVRNNQVNLLACGGDSDEPNERDLELAVRRARNCAFPGVLDCFEQSVSAGAETLRQVFPELDCARPAANVSRGMQGTLAGRIAELRDACDPDVWEELLQMTALDRRLVDAARCEVMGRVERVRPRVARTAVPRERPVRGERVELAKAALRLVGLAPYWRQLAGTGRETLFDEDYYGGSYPLLDFLVTGAWEGRQPHPLFDPAFYLRKYPDVAAAGVNPFCHYLKRGWRELRQPHPLFDPGYYLERNPDVRLARVDPLLHYLRNGAAEDRKPHRLFEPKYYRASCGKTLLPGQNPLVHFLEAGAAGASPHPLFDCGAYLDAHPEVAERGLNPLVHYLDSGGGESAGSDACVNIQDVRVTVDWQEAEAQQIPFLRAVGVDQLRAQLDSSR